MSLLDEYDIGYDSNIDVYDSDSESLQKNAQNDLASSSFVKKSSASKSSIKGKSLKSSTDKFLEETSPIEMSEKCQHSQTEEMQNGILYCAECGITLVNLTFEPEYRYYGHSDNRYMKDPSRCHKSNLTGKDRNIESVLKEVHLNTLPSKIKDIVEEKYMQIVGETTTRGNHRKAIICACLFHTYREEGNPKTSDELIKQFDISRKDMGFGLNEYNSCFRDNNDDCISYMELIKGSMKNAEIPLEHYPNIMKLANLLQNKSCHINRSSPKSAACAIIYLYICLKPNLKQSLGLSKAKFAEKSRLSDITITKLVQESALLLGRPIEL